MTGKQTAPAPTASELRQEARLILDRIRVTADREQKHRLAVRAFELVQLAEQVLHAEEQRNRMQARAPQGATFAVRQQESEE